MSGRRVVLLVALIVVATAVLPPLAATAVNRLRVSRASAEAAELLLWLDAPGRVPSAPRVALRGPGDWPQFAGDAAEIGRLPRTSLPGLGELPVGADPWGNAYIVLMGEAGDMRLRVISAGTDGIVTSGRARATGDDIVAAR